MVSETEYQSLYRRFRPQRFSEVLGQEHVTRALQNAVASLKVSHAYLFSGPRGTGKTSTARILAKALNCENPLMGEPCCICESCKLVTAGRSFDVEELDAASNSGVDAIRSLVSTVSTATLSEWKIYIVDEVHMLSTAASNALLKTLEEPPPHVIFVLATTDAQKVLPTIRSRTQHFEFKLLADETLEKLLSSISVRADVTVSDLEVSWLINKGGGSARDTLSYFDQVLALGGVPELNDSEIEQLVLHLLAKDVPAVIEITETLARSGVDALRISTDILSVLRSAFLYLIGYRVGDKDGQVPKVISLAKAHSVSFPTVEVTRAMEKLGQLSLGLREALDPIVVLEAALISLMSIGSEQTGVVGTGDNDRLMRLEVEVHELRTEIARLVAPYASPSDPSLAGTFEHSDQIKASTGSPSTFQRPVEVGSDGVRARTTSARREALASIRREIEDPKGKSESSTPPEVTTEKAPVVTPVQDLTEQVPRRDRQRNESKGLSRADSSLEGELSDPVAPFDGEPFTFGEVMETSKELTGLPIESKTAGESLPRRERLVFDWAEEISSSLTPRARARFQATRFLEVQGTKVVIAAPNKMHLSRLEELRREVEAAIASFYGLESVEIGLVVESSHEGELIQESDEGEPEGELYEQFKSAPKSPYTDPLFSTIEQAFPGAKELGS